jgi:hypothetical protein
MGSAQEEVIVVGKKWERSVPHHIILRKIVRIVRKIL